MLRAAHLRFASRAAAASARALRPSDLHFLAKSGQGVERRLDLGVGEAADAKEDVQCDQNGKARGDHAAQDRADKGDEGAHEVRNAPAAADAEDQQQHPVEALGQGAKKHLVAPENLSADGVEVGHSGLEIGEWLKHVPKSMG